MTLNWTFRFLGLRGNLPWYHASCPELGVDMPMGAMELALFLKASTIPATVAIDAMEKSLRDPTVEVGITGIFDL